MAAKIVTRRKSYRSRPSWEYVEEHLRKVLYQNPPISVSEASRSIGILAPHLRLKFPELIAAIARRFEEHVQIQKEERKKQLWHEVWESVVWLGAKGIYPSQKEVIARVKVSRNIGEICRVLAEVKREAANNPSWKKQGKKS